MLVGIEVKCRFCNKKKVLVVEKEDYNRYMNGELVQNCFPYLSADDRERLITGICTRCFP